MKSTAPLLQILRLSVRSVTHPRRHSLAWCLRVPSAVPALFAAHVAMRSRSKQILQIGLLWTLPVSPQAASHTSAQTLEVEVRLQTEPYEHQDGFAHRCNVMHQWLHPCPLPSPNPSKTVDKHSHLHTAAHRRRCILARWRSGIAFSPFPRGRTEGRKEECLRLRAHL